MNHHFEMTDYTSIKLFNGLREKRRPTKKSPIHKTEFIRQKLNIFAGSYFLLHKSESMVGK